MKKKVDVRPAPRPKIKLGASVSLLASDYEKLKNHPKINGVELIGNVGAIDLKLLPLNAEEYEEQSIGDARRDGVYLVTLSNDGAKKVKLPVELGFKTVGEIDHASEVGAYQFVEKK